MSFFEMKNLRDDDRKRHDSTSSYNDDSDDGYDDNEPETGNVKQFEKTYPFTRKNEEGVVETVVTTQNRSPTIANSITLELGKTTFHVRGWKACAVETIVLGFTLLGAVAAGYHGVDMARSLKSRFF